MAVLADHTFFMLRKSNNAIFLLFLHYSSLWRFFIITSGR